MQNEAVKTLEKYFNNKCGSTIQYFGAATHAEKVANHLNTRSLYLLEYPDLFSRLGNEVILIEHFEFDGFKNTKKGSALRREIASIDQKLKVLNNKHFITK